MSDARRVHIEARKRQLELEAMAMSNQPMTDKEPAYVRAGQRFNAGILSLISMPTDLVNAGIRFVGGDDAPQIPNEYTQGSAFRQRLAEMGSLPEGDKPAEGVLENMFEMIGAGVLPHAAITARGNAIINQSIQQMQNMGILSNMAKGTAARPYAAAAGEVTAAAGASTGRVIAQDNNASPSVQILAELLGGFTPAAMLGIAQLAYRVSSLRAISTTIKENLFPYTKAGAWPKASRRLRQMVADPEAAASKIDVDSDMPVARQIGDEDLLALEKAVYKKDPEMALEMSRNLNKVREALRQEAMGFFGGDPTRPRELLKKGKQYLLDMLDMRTAQASRDLESKLSKLEPDADIREINRATREVVDEAYVDARKTEKALWDSLDDSVEISPDKGREALNAELAKRSRFADPEDIPNWARKALGPEELDPKLEAQLRKAGAIDSNGQFVPGMREKLIEQGVIPKREYTFNELKDLRSRLLREIRKEGATDAPNRNKIRILDDIATGLLDDIGESGVEGAAAAREFSRRLNERFTRGQVGKLFGHDKTGAGRITPETTLDALLNMRDSAASVEQLLRASPEARPFIRQFLAREFISATDSGQNTSAATRFVEKWSRRGVFKEFPNLKDELLELRGKSEKAQKAAARATKARSFASKSGKSTTALYLDSDPGAEMSAVLSAKRPVAAARKLYAKVKGDKAAQAGLRTHFLEEGFQFAETNNFYTSGEPIYSGNRFTKYLSNNKEVAKALGVTDAEWDRLENIALKMRQVEAKPGTRVDELIKDAPAAILDLAARYIGAQQGGRLGNNMGSSLVLAGAFSEKARSILGKLNKNTATQLLIDAHRDPKLYRALLVHPNSPEPVQEKAVTTIQNWLISVGVMQDDQATER